MTKTKRMLQSQLALVDVVIELLDARIPYSSRNPDLEHLARHKARIIVLTKADLADPDATQRWSTHYRESGHGVLVLDARKKNETLKVISLAQDLMREKHEKQRERGRVRSAIRALVVGIPNVGKSTFINSLSRRAGAATGDKPGITRGRQWINIQPDFDMLDTPGVLWPKFEDPEVGLRLAITGAVSDDILDKITLCEGLLAMLAQFTGIESRYRIKLNTNEEPRITLERIGEIRGFKMKGGTVDIERTAIMVIDEFRDGKLGRVTLDSDKLPMQRV